MNTEHDTRTYTQAASALGMSLSCFARTMKLKGFKPVKGPSNAKLVTRDDILRLLGRSISDDAWNAVKGVKARPGKREQQRRDILKCRALGNAELRDKLLPFDLGWIAAHVRERDKEWQRAALAQNVEIKPPPFPGNLHAQLASQQVFTQADVAELMHQHIARRDADWRVWITDAQERALHPNGPPAIGSDEFFADNLGATNVDH